MKKGDNMGLFDAFTNKLKCEKCGSEFGVKKVTIQTSVGTRKIKCLCAECAMQEKLKQH